MKNFKRLLAVALVLCMVLGVMPLSTFAAETSKATTTENSEDYRILHLDCGRKYFTKDWIIALINEMAAAGYTHLELAFGNDGLRFLLDDMSVGSYTDDQVTAAIQQGNKNYYDFGTNELTEAEMDAIIAHAGSKGIEIIPLFNNPGHMNTVVSAATTLTGSSAGYNGSSSTVDLENTAAVSFTKGLLEKYIAYFDGKGCKEFNFGADEYANDVYPYGSMGFGALVSAGKYQLYVAYVNEVAALIKGYGMTPIAFNDGIYFNQNTSYNFDKDITVAFWTSGWSGYQSASASTMETLGHEMINVNGDYYYVLGKSDQWDSNGYTYAANWSNTTFMGSTVSDPAGSMFCIWCDYPDAETETQIAANTRMILRAMAAEMQGNDANSVGTDVVAGGFNADGTINGDPSVEPEPQPDPVTKTDDATGIAVTAPGLTGLTVEKTTAPSVEGAVSVLAWELSPVTESGSYTGSATVSVPVPADWTKVLGGVLASENGKAVSDITGTLENGVFTFTVPHLSTVYVYQPAPTAIVPDETIELEVGGTHEIVIKDVNYDGEYTTDPAGFATVIAKHEEVEGSVAVTPATSLTNGSAYYIIDSSGKYLAADLSWVDTADKAVTWTASYYYSMFGTDYYYLSHNGQYLVDNNGNGSWSTGDIYSATMFGIKNGVLVNSENDNTYTAATVSGTAAVNQSTITFTGVAPGTTYVTVGDTTYKIVVHGTVEITINYVDAGNNTIKTEKIIVRDDATSVTVSNFNTDDGKFYTVAETTLTIGPKNETSYTVTVTEAEEDLNNVDPLTIYYWITNKAVIIDGASSMQLAAGTVYGENGVAFATLVPASDNAEENPYVFWRGWLLPDGYHQYGEQTSADMCTDENGTLIQKIRYWNGKWAYFNGTDWVDIKDTDQVNAYYQQQTQVTDEVTTDVIDWGESYKDWRDNRNNAAWFWGSYVENGSKFIFLDFAVVYEGGSQAPDSFPTDDTWFFHFDGDFSESNPRLLKPITFVENDKYEIWQITVTDGVATSYSSAANFASTYDDTTETVVWDEKMGGTPEIESLAYTANKSGKLIRIYIRAVETEDSLTVVYYDEKFGDTLYTYSIHVENDKDFTNGIVGATEFVDNADRINVKGAYIVNVIPEREYFETDLTQVPFEKGKYNKELYKYTGSKISEDGKTLYMYYNIDTTVLSPNFVADFGLPLQFHLSEMVKVDAVDSVGALSARYGTLTYDSSSKTFTYTPTKILQNIDVLTITLTVTGETVTTNVGVTPATTVYYEEGFLENWSGTWTDNGTKHSFANQTAQILGSSTDNYGYDSNITSNGSDATTSTIGASATFTFTGTGFDLYANCDENTGYVLVEVRDSANVLKRVFMVNTKVATAENATDATSGQTGAFKSLPVVTLEGLTHGAYTVTVKKITDEKAINIDGFRIYGTIKEDITTNEDGTVTNNSIYKSDLEDNPEFHEIRDNVLTGVNIEDSKYNYANSLDDANGYYDISGLAQYIHSQVYAADSTLAGALVMSGENVAYDAGALKDLLDNGPKNELFLYAGQSVTFSVTTNRVMQIGLKAPQGATSYTITANGTTVGNANTAISSSVDMFYDVWTPAKNDDGTNVSATVAVTITNAGTGILSVTDLKICDDPNAAFNALTAADIEAALNAMGYADAEPENPETPAAPEDSDDSKTPEDPKATCADHKGGTATCKDKAVCTVCGEAYGELDAENHTGEAKWSHTDGKHSKAYDCCGKVVVAEEAHKLTDGKCECGYEAPASDDNSQTSDNSQTGDNSHVVLFGSLLVISALAAIVLLVPDVRKKLIK